MSVKPNDELRMLACAHSNNNAASLISLLDMSNPTKRSPISVASLHLIELTGRESAMLIAHDTDSMSSKAGGFNITQNEVQAKDIMLGKSSLYAKRSIVLLFFGGPDNQEALSYASRMAEHPAVTLTVVGFVPGKQVAAAAPSMSPPMSSSDTNELLQHSSVIDIGNFEADTTQIPDKEYVNEIRTRNVHNELIEYVERMVNNSEEMVAAIRVMDSMFDLCIVWWSQGVSLMTAGLTEWMACPELGPIGGLAWINRYWGRDVSISGATGQCT